MKSIPFTPYHLVHTNELQQLEHLGSQIITAHEQQAEILARHEKELRKHLQILLLMLVLVWLLLYLYYRQMH